MTTGQPTLKQAHLQGTQSQYTKANHAKELAFPHMGHTLPFVETQTEKKHERTTWGLPKWGRTEAVFQLLFFNLASYRAGRY